MMDPHYLTGKLAAALFSSLLPWEFSAMKRSEILSRLCSELSEQERANRSIIHPSLKHTMLKQQMAMSGTPSIR